MLTIKRASSPSSPCTLLDLEPLSSPRERRPRLTSSIHYNNTNNEHSTLSCSSLLLTSTIMDTTTTDSSTSTSPPSTGGTTATQDSVAPTDFEKLASALNRLECQKQQPIDSTHNNNSSDDCDMATQRLPQLTGLSSPSRLSSPSSGSHVSSPTFLSKSPLRSLVDTCSDFDLDSRNVSMQSEVGVYTRLVSYLCTNFTQAIVFPTEIQDAFRPSPICATFNTKQRWLSCPSVI